MSNLNPPTLTYSNLAPMLKPGKLKKIGYETYAHLATNAPTHSVLIMHHNSVIAELGDPKSNGFVYVTNAHYGSSTIRNRIHKVLVDNGVSARVTQRNFVQVLEVFDVLEVQASKGITAHTGFVSAWFENDTSGHKLSHFNGELV